MRVSRGMGVIDPAKLRAIKKKDGSEPVQLLSKGGESRVNESGVYTKPSMRKRLFESIKAGGKGAAPGQWSARKAQMLAKQYKSSGGGYRE
jgi:hypothetical protein